MNAVAARVAALETAFRAIESGRMRGLPMLHPALAVQAVDFEADATAGIALGVLVTPWFMNLMRLPLHEGVPMLPVGETGEHETGTQRIGFIGAHEPAFGAYEACSLFSPMAGFADQSAAVATARQVMLQLRGRPTTLPPQQPARRGFLFGRSGAAA